MWDPSRSCVVKADNSAITCMHCLSFVSEQGEKRRRKGSFRSARHRHHHHHHHHHHQDHHHHHHHHHHHYLVFSPSLPATHDVPMSLYASICILIQPYSTHMHARHRLNPFKKRGRGRACGETNFFFAVSLQVLLWYTTHCVQMITSHLHHSQPLLHGSIKASLANGRHGYETWRRGAALLNQPNWVTLPYHSVIVSSLHSLLSFCSLVPHFISYYAPLAIILMKHSHACLKFFFLGCDRRPCSCHVAPRFVDSIIEFTGDYAKTG